MRAFVFDGTGMAARSARSVRPMRPAIPMHSARFALAGICVLAAAALSLGAFSAAFADEPAGGLAEESASLAADGPAADGAVDLASDERISLAVLGGPFTYTAAPQTPKITMTCGDTVLVEDVDYTLSYTDNVHAGTATVVATAVEGSGYTGSASAEFTIQRAKITSVALSATRLAYNGKARKPSVTAKAKCGEETVALITRATAGNENVRITYPKGRVNVGKYTIRVVGQGDFTGSFAKTFTIVPRATSFSKRTVWGKSVDLIWYKRVKQTTGYQIRYSTVKSMDNAKRITVSKNTVTKRTIKNLKLKTNYYLQIRTYKKYSNGNVYYSRWSDPVHVKTLKEYSISEGLHLKRTAFVKYMKSHLNDGYYLGTPWCNDTGLYNDYVWPNGHPRSDGYVGFNCAGFVTRAFQDAGADVSGIERTAKRGTSPYMRSAGAFAWLTYAKENGMKVTRYGSVGSMLRSGELKKGDIIISEPISWYDADADTHIMIFWGKDSHENKVWHTTTNNQISPVKPGCTRSRFYVVSMGD